MAGIVSSGYVEVRISSNVSSFAALKRFPLSTTIVELKVRCKYLQLLYINLLSWTGEIGANHRSFS